MKHLTVDEIIDFISLTELNKEAIELSAAVNGHIRKCEKCLKLVRAFQMIYDEFCRLDNSGDFKKFAEEEILTEKSKNERTVELQITLDEFDGLR